MPKLRTEPTPKSARLALYPYQRQAVAKLEDRNGLAALFMTMGTGKTPTTISYLARAGYKRILVVGPIAAVGVWKKQLRELDAPWEVITLAGGPVEKAAKRLQLLRPTEQTRVIIVNLDSYWRYPAETRKIKNKRTGVIYARRLKLRGIRRELLRWKPDAVIIDEAHRISNRTTFQSKFAHELAQLKSVGARVPLTGSLINEDGELIVDGIESLFSIYKFMDPTVLGTSYGDFERRFIIRGGFRGYQILGYRNIHQIERILKQTSVQVGDKVLGLPKRVTQVVPVQLEPKSRKLYETMRRDAIIEIETLGPDGQMLHGKALSMLMLTTLIRLQQITSGFIPVMVPDVEDTEQPPASIIVDIGDEKLQTAINLIEDALSGKKQVVVFVKFIHDMARLVGSMPHHFKAGTPNCFYCGKKANTKIHLAPTKESYVATISGNVAISGPTNRRDKTVEDFSKGKYKVLIVQMATGSLSIDLTAASVAIFYSTGYSLLEFGQARGRVYRHGQTKHVVEYLLQVENSIDETIHLALSKKQEVARKVSNVKDALSLLGMAESDALEIFGGN